MDQLKELLAKLGKHGFWISCGLVTVISLAVWWMATGSLIEQYNKEAANLDAAVSAISSIRSQMPTHPNDASHEMMETLVAEQREEVLEAWRMQYRDQQEILVWPKRLGEVFISEFAPLVPIELNFQEFPVPEDLEKETTLRERYRDYIQDVMGPLAEKAGAEWKADFKAKSGGMGGMGGYGSEMEGPGGDMGAAMEYGPGMGMGMTNGNRLTPQKKPPLVEWPTQSQEALLSDLFPWRGNIPSTLEVLYSQENVWVLDQLLQIVAATNGDATERFQAKIHEIQAIGIGRTATRAAGIVSPVGGGGAGMGMGMGMGMEGEGSYGGGEMGSGMGMGGPMEMGAGMEMGMGMEGGYGMAGEGGMQAPARDPAEGRYVNVDYEPIEASRVRSAMVSNSPEDASLAVAKRIPVKLRLKMDQRAIPQLLANCGNASLMVEVRQIRIDPTGTATGSGGGYGMGGGGYGAEMGGYGAEMGGMGEMPGYGSEMGGGMEMMGGVGGYGGGRNVPQSFPMDMAVEVYGIIYLFNPPSAESLGIEQVNEDTVIDGKSMAEEAVDTGVVAAPVDGVVNAPEEPEETTDSSTPTEPTETTDSSTPTEPAGSAPTGPAAGAAPAASGGEQAGPAVPPAAPAAPAAPPGS